MYLDNEQIKEVLLAGNYLQDEDVVKVEEIAKSDDLPFGEACIVGEFVTRDLIGQAVAEWYRVPYADINSRAPGVDQVKKISKDIAMRRRLVLFEEDEKTVTVATDNPDQEGIREFTKQMFKPRRVTIAYALSTDIDSVLLVYRAPLQQRLESVIETDLATAPEMIAEIFDEALITRSSDIHFEPGEDDFRIRLRIDGVMQELVRLPKKYYENILNWIKVQGKMRIDEHFAAQDGAMHYTQEGIEADMRISIVPTLLGEKIAIRLLVEYVSGFSFNEIGITGLQAEMLNRAVHKPFGMILVVGPTGSGKTTTLYSILRLLNRPGINITTIEDPVEYRISGVNQIKVNEASGLTFARGLRSIVRQDPDIILVGEIRDVETAEIAVNAALTGHLVLSTFHANDAATAIPRLLDMGVEPFLLSSTLELVIGQRLVRTISEECKRSRTLKPTEVKKEYPQLADYLNTKGQKTVTLYENACSDGEGYRGRTGIFEVVEMTPELKDLTLTHPSAREIWNLARKNGNISLFEDGVDKVKSGVTTPEELLRVAEPPQKEHGKRKK